MQLSFDQIVERRRAVRVYDADFAYDTSIVDQCVQQATLAPSSSNMQLWEFIKVSNPQVKGKLAEYCMKQSAARTANELLIVVVRKDLYKERAHYNLEEIMKTLKGKTQKDYQKRDRRAIAYYKKLMPNLYGDFLGIYGFFKSLYTWYIGLKRPMYREVKQSDMRVVAHKSAALAAQTFMLAMTAKGYDTCPMEGFDSKRVKSLVNLPSSAEISMIISCGKRAENGVYHERRRLPLEKVYRKIQ